MIRQPLRAKAPQQQQIGQSLSRLAPVGGWNTKDPLASMGPQYARVLENFFPTASDVGFRKGVIDHVVGVTGNVKTLMPFIGQTGNKMFAASDTKIFDATVAGTNPPQLVARTKGEHVYTNFTGTGGSFLFAVNGLDDMAMYTASSNTWSTVASFPITGGGTLATNTIAFVGVFKGMLFFLTNAGTDFYFLPIDQISGTVSKFPLGRQMNEGGYLVAFNTWAVDQSDGSDDFCVFATSRGQLIVYAGTDPSAASTWVLKGRYNIGPPIGRNCLKKQRGDLYVLSQSGLFSLNTAFASTTSSLRPGFTDKIAPTFREFASLTGSTYGWQTEIHELEKLLVINVPQQGINTFNQFVMNLDTGAWCRFTGWNAFNFAVMDSVLYFAGVGKVSKAWQGGSDYGNSVTATAVGAFDYLTPRAANKSFSLVRPTYTISGNGTASFGLDVDFRNSERYENNIMAAGSNSRWDSAQWDVSVFAGLPVPTLDWQTLSAQEGYCVSFRLRFIGQDATFAWTATDYVYQSGSPV